MDATGQMQRRPSAVKISVVLLVAVCVVAAGVGGGFWVADGISAAWLTKQVGTTLGVDDGAHWRVDEIVKDLQALARSLGLPTDDVHDRRHYPHSHNDNQSDSDCGFSPGSVYGPIVGVFAGLVAVAASGAVVCVYRRRTGPTLRRAHIGFWFQAVFSGLLGALSALFLVIFVLYGIWATVLALTTIVASDKLLAVSATITAPTPSATACPSSCLDLTAYGVRPNWVDPATIQLCVCSPTTLRSLQMNAWEALQQLGSSAGGLLGMYLAGVLLATVAFAQLSSVCTLHRARKHNLLETEYTLAQKKLAESQFLHSSPDHQVPNTRDDEGKNSADGADVMVRVEA